MTVVADHPVQPTEPETGLPVDHEFMLRVDRVELDPDNRRPPEEVEIAAVRIAASIKAVGGQTDAIVVIALANGRYRVHEGNCRLRAHQLLGRTKIRARIRLGFGTRSDRLINMLAIHATRRGFDPIAEAEMFRDLMFGDRTDGERYTREQVAQLSGYSTSTVASRLQLLNLTTWEQEQVRSGLLPIVDALQRVRERAGREQQRRGPVASAADIVAGSAAARHARRQQPVEAPRTGPHANLYAMHTNAGGWQATYSRREYDAWRQAAADDAALDDAAGIARTFFRGQLCWFPEPVRAEAAAS